jgi:putative membrane protein
MLVDRRSIVAAGTLLPMFASSLLAQTSGPAPGPAVESGPAEKQHMAETMRAGSLALLTSRLARDKAKDKLVKQFADFEIAEQQTIAEVIKAVQGANLQTGAGVAPNQEAESELDDKGREVLSKLKSASGAAFDKEYLESQKEGHQQLLKIQQAYLSSGKSREEVGIAKLASGRIKEHLTLLDYIRDSLKG